MSIEIVWMMMVLVIVGVSIIGFIGWCIVESVSNSNFVKNRVRKSRRNRKKRSNYDW